MFIETLIDVYIVINIIICSPLISMGGYVFFCLAKHPEAAAHGMLSGLITLHEMKNKDKKNIITNMFFGLILLPVSIVSAIIFLSIYAFYKRNIEKMDPDLVVEINKLL